MSNIKAYLCFYYIPETTSKVKKNRIAGVVLCPHFRENSDTMYVQHVHIQLADIAVCTKLGNKRQLKQSPKHMHICGQGNERACYTTERTLLLSLREL